MTTPITPKILIPPNLDIKSSADELIITYRWWSIWYIAVAIFAFICNGYILYLAVLKIVFLVDVDPFTLLLLVPGLAIAYYALAGLFNRTTVRVTSNHLQITHGPLPYYGSINLPTEYINQLYITETLTRADRKTTNYRCELHVQLNNDSKDKTLIKGLETPLNALYLEQEIEHYLGIKDTIVPQEGDKNTHQEAQRSWQAIAQAHNFTFVPGKRPELMMMSGTYHDHTLGVSVFRKEYPQGRLHTRLVLAADSAQTAKTYPTPRQVVRLMDRINQGVRPNFIDIAGSGQKIIFEEPGLETQAKQLIYLFDSFRDLLDAYPYMASLGGEAIVTLKQVAADKKHRLHILAGQWIEDIARHTHHLEGQASRLVCQLCMVHCTAHQVDLSWLSWVTFYGCRECLQSRDFYEVDRVMAVLDTDMGTEAQDGSILRVNWFKQGTLFDFDSVEIINATDEEVERFVIQLSPISPAHIPVYGEMECTVSSNCRLSENTLRILNKTFGYVRNE